MRRGTICILLLAAAFAQTPEKPAPGSVSGVVRDAGSGTPMKDVQVVVYVSGHSVFARTDSEGQHKLADLPPGEYRLAAADRGTGASTQVQVRVGPGQDVEKFDIRLVALGTIAGRVVDENKEPVPGMRVYLIDRNYALGELRYNMGDSKVTNDQGAYRIGHAVPGRAYLLVAKKDRREQEVLSDAPEDPKLRKRALASTYYPGVTTIEGASPVSIRSGEIRENVDMRVARTTSYCIDGVIDDPAGSFSLVERYPLQEMLPLDIGMTVSFAPPTGRTGADGKFRVCDLHPDEYIFTAFGSGAGSFSSTVVVPLTISDSDIHKMRLAPAPGPPLEGEAIWDSPPTREIPEASVSLYLKSLTRGSTIPREMNALSATSKIPSAFRFEHVIADDYSVSVDKLPEGAYLKDVTYGSRSIYNKPLRIGSAMTQAELRIVLGHDGGFVMVQMSDPDGKPIQQANVVIAPTTARSEAEFAAALTAGRTNQAGVFQTGAVAPGKYLVLASNSVVDYTPETIGRLYGARNHAEEVEVGAGKTVQVKLNTPVQ